MLFVQCLMTVRTQTLSDTTSLLRIAFHCEYICADPSPFVGAAPVKLYSPFIYIMMTIQLYVIDDSYGMLTFIRAHMLCVVFLY